MGSQILLVTIAFFLVLLNGFFVAAEFGLVKLRQTRVKAIAKTHGMRGRILQKVHLQLDAYLSACQLGITLASLGLGWVGEPAFARLIEPVFRFLGMQNEKLLHGTAFFFAFFLISFLHIVVGELAPKSVAIRRSERVGLWTATPLYIFYWVMWPAIWVLNQSSNFVLRLFHLSSSHADNHYSAEELKLILRDSNVDKNFTQEEWRTLAQSLDFRTLNVADLMRPFNEAIVLSAQDSVQHSIERISQHRFSRYPYISEQGRVQGVIHLKDIFLDAFKHSTLPDTLEDLVRPIQIVSPNLPATELFRRFQQGAPHFAVVAYQDDRPLGFVTLDNLLGALVGEIRDEFRQAQNEWVKLDDGSYLGKGSLTVVSLERALGIDIEQDEVDTVGGLLMFKLENLPEQGQRVEFEQFDVVVKKMHGPRILLVRVYPKHKHSQGHGAHH